MKITKAFGFILASAAFCALFFIPKPASAADCGLDAGSFATIKAIQNNPNLSYLEEIKQELALRQKLLSDTIICAKNDVTDLQKQLNSVSVPDSAKNLQSSLSSDLDGAANYYNLELAAINSAGIAGTQKIAANVLSWRANNYQTLSGQVNNFILWAGTQPLISAADNRLTQMQHAVSILQIADAYTQKVQDALEAAQKSLTSAQNENADAQNAMAQSLPPDQSLSLIKESLQSLSDAYQDFFDLNGYIQALVGS